jgi:hypothetical protein
VNASGREKEISVFRLEKTEKWEAGSEEKLKYISQDQRGKLEFEVGATERVYKKEISKNSCDL